MKSVLISLALAVELLTIMAAKKTTIAKLVEAADETMDAEKKIIKSSLRVLR